MTESAARGRADRVAEASRRWADRLVDGGGHDSLLFHRDLKVGTVDLVRAEPVPRKALLDGTPTRLSRLFPNDPIRTSATRSVRVIRDRVREVAEERGVHVGHLALGMATWHDAQGRVPAAPVLLRRVDVRAEDAAEQDFVLHVADEAEVNPVLLDHLATELGLRIRAEDLLDPYGALVYTHVVDRLREFAPAHVVDGFRLEHRAVLGTFSYAELSMVQDLRTAGDLLAGHDVVAALAGDPEALALVRARDGAAADPAYAEPVGAERDPTGELLVLDADRFQQAVVDDVLAGRHLVVQGAPGTGKSQTIANLVAALVGQGRRVLFVAEKRAAIDAVVGRLQRVGLDDVVLDLPDGEAEGDRPAALMAHTAASPRPEAARAEDRDLVAHRDALRDHISALHDKRQPWGMSAYAAYVTVEGTPRAARTDHRLTDPQLDALDADTRRRLRAQLRDLVELGALDRTPADSRWAEATVDTGEDAGRTLNAVRRLRTQGLPGLRDTVTRASVEVGLPAPATIAEARARTDLAVGVRTTLEILTEQVWDAPLPDVVAATATRQWRTKHGVSQGWPTRRRLRRGWRELRRPGPGPVGDTASHDLAVAAAEQLDTWRATARDGRPPRVGRLLEPALAARSQVDDDLTVLGTALPDLAARLPDLPFAEVTAVLGELAAQEPVLLRLPRIRAARAALRAAGLQPLVGELAERGADGDTAVAAYDHAVASSVLAAVRRADPRVAAFRGEAHDRVVADYRDADVRHLARSAARVRRAYAEQLAAVQEAHPEQAALVAADAAPGRGHESVRELLRVAPDVLLAVRPCWALSPLMVPRLLPAERMFDVVVFDEASRVPPAHAVSSIARGEQVVVVGDEWQLPPTAAPDAGSESVLGVLSTVLPTRMLRWHYRSRDERLVAFSNTAFYDHALTTFPGVGVTECLRHEVVEQLPASDGADSVLEEVERVTNLVLHHARTRPHESLGVVTLSPLHADRVSTALRISLAQRRELLPFFAADQDEPFFVKDVERVQGDERDVVVLSIGYGRAPDGRLTHRFGPLDRAGGERCLNVAVTRARRRMTVVSSFSAADLDPDRLTTDGARRLRDYLAYAAAGGAATARDADEPGPDAVEAAIADRLRAEGLPLTVRHGVGGQVDLALAHPEHAEHLVLAVDTDGPAYRDTWPTRDRDRLRPEHLRRIGWSHLRVWTLDWLSDPDAVVTRVRSAYDAALADLCSAEDGRQPAVASEADLSAYGFDAPDDRPRSNDQRLRDDVPPHWS